MPKFRFSIVDSAGQSRSGTIEAVSEAEAAFNLRQRGFELTAISPLGGADSDWDRPREVRAGGGMPQVVRRWLAGLPMTSVLPLVLSGAALLFSMGALIATLVRDPLGRGLRHYDFSTPEAATRSMLQIDVAGDIRARLDLDRVRGGGDPLSILKSLEVKRVTEYQGKRIAFASYEEGQKKRKKLFSFELDPVSKLWVPTYLSPYQVEKTDERLGKEMQAWLDAGED